MISLLSFSNMKPLKGKRIIDFTHWLPGPYATMLLQELGAEVIKIEPPQGDPMRAMPPLLEDGTSSRFVLLNQGKKSVCLNLKDAKQQQTCLRLMASADAVIDGFRPGVVQRLGVHYEAIKTLNPDIVYASLTGYGQDGPYRDHVGHDLNYAGVAGILSMTGLKQPTIPGVQIADLAGAMHTAFGVLAALWESEKTGQGRYLDVSMTDSAFHMMALHLAEFSATGEAPNPNAMSLTGAYPCYNLYETQDGQWLTITCIESKFWVALCERLGHPEFIPLQFDAGEQREQIFKVFREIFLSKSLSNWLEKLDPTVVPVAPANNVATAINDPQVKQRGLFQNAKLASPIAGKNDQTTGKAPQLGEHNQALLSPND